MVYQPENWALYLAKSDQELISASRTDYFRGSGRGGQKKNKTSNAVRLVLGSLIVTETSSRSRSSNLHKAVRKLRIKIAFDYKDAIQFRGKQVLIPEKIRSYSSKGLIRINKKNNDYPLFIGYLVNVIISVQRNYQEAAAIYGVSQSQLRKFVKNDNSLIEVLNNIPEIQSTE